MYVRHSSYQAFKFREPSKVDEWRHTSIAMNSNEGPQFLSCFLYWLLLTRPISFFPIQELWSRKPSGSWFILCVFVPFCRFISYVFTCGNSPPFCNGRLTENFADCGGYILFVVSMVWTNPRQYSTRVTPEYSSCYRYSMTGAHCLRQARSYNGSLQFKSRYWEGLYRSNFALLLAHLGPYRLFGNKQRMRKLPRLRLQIHVVPWRWGFEDHIPESSSVGL